MTRAIVCLCIVLGGVIAAACGRESSKQTTSPTASSVAATATVASGERDAPMPRHVTFAPGETIAADGQAGIFFLDAKTGAAEGWVVPASRFPGAEPAYDLPYTFTIGGVSADGGKIVYTCLLPQASGAPRPCDGTASRTWYLLDTRTGARTRLDGFTGALVTLSPDGRMLVGETPDGAAIAKTSTPGDTRALALPADARGLLFADWSPDGANVIVRAGTRGYPTIAAYLARVADGRAVELSLPDPQVAWASDGSKVTLVAQGASAELSDLLVLDRDGGVVWSRKIHTFSPNPEWSADGTLLSVQVLGTLPSPATPSGIDRLDILDGATGATRYRVAGAIGCQGPVWAGDTHKLIVDQYFGASGSTLVDLEGGGMRALGTYVTPAPFSAQMGVAFNGKDFSSIDLATAQSAIIAKTTVQPSWDPLHQIPLFAGGRIVFTALHGGHGGCAEGASPDTPPKLEILYPPFAGE